jgi:hypothetical protein
MLKIYSQIFNFVNILWFVLINCNIIRIAFDTKRIDKYMLYENKILQYTCDFLNLPNPSGRTRPWSLLSL